MKECHIKNNEKLSTKGLSRSHSRRAPLFTSTRSEYRNQGSFWISGDAKKPVTGDETDTNTVDYSGRHPLTYYNSTINWHLIPRKKFNRSGGEIRSWITFHIFIHHFHAWNSFSCQKSRSFNYQWNFVISFDMKSNDVTTFPVSWQIALIISWRISFPVPNSEGLESGIFREHIMVLGKNLIRDLLSIFFSIIWNLLRNKVPLYCTRPFLIVSEKVIKKKHCRIVRRRPL